MAEAGVGEVASVLIRDSAQPRDESDIAFGPFLDGRFSGGYVESAVGITPKLSPRMSVDARKTILHASATASAAIASIVVSDDQTAPLTEEAEMRQIQALLADLRDKFGK